MSRPLVTVLQRNMLGRQSDSRGPPTRTAYRTLCAYAAYARLCTIRCMMNGRDWRATRGGLVYHTSSIRYLL